MTTGPTAPCGTRRRTSSDGWASVSLKRDGLTRSIQAPASVFTSVFGVKADRLRRIRPTSTRDLDVPDELEPFVDAIVVLPPPEYFE